MLEDNTPELTPIEAVGDIWLKRDDTYRIAGIAGGKVRACWHLAHSRTAAPAAYQPGLVTASARKSPQMQIVARIAERLGVPARLHTATGNATHEMQDAVAHGGELVQHRPGYNSVIMKRAEDDAKQLGWKYIPFGMEHPAAMACTRAQVRNIPPGVKRVVVVLGSGMSAAGILWGLQDQCRGMPVLGIQIGADPHKRLNQYAPQFWMRKMTIVTSRHSYEEEVKASVGGVVLDPHYEAKCAEYLEPGDLFWLVGVRAGLPGTV